MRDSIQKADEYVNNKELQLLGLGDEEKEVAQIILQELSGLHIIRATQILDFCKTALQFEKIQ